jgi:trk system potassium uptake protein TrkA
LKKEFAVIGLGRFGFNLVKSLFELGHEVLALDYSKHKVQKVSEIIPNAVQADALDENTLKDVGIKNFDNVIVAIGQDIEASILVTLSLKDMGIKNVVAKALNERHGKVLKRIGADKVVFPEKDMAQRLAHHLVAQNFLDYIELSSEYGIVEMQPLKNMIGKELRIIDLRKKTGISIISIKKKDKLITAPGGEALIEKDDILVAIGAYKDFERLQSDE